MRTLSSFFGYLEKTASRVPCGKLDPGECHVRQTTDIEMRDRHGRGGGKQPYRWIESFRVCRRDDDATLRQWRAPVGEIPGQKADDRADIAAAPARDALQCLQ